MTPTKALNILYEEANTEDSKYTQDQKNKAYESLKDIIDMHYYLIESNEHLLKAYKKHLQIISDNLKPHPQIRKPHIFFSQRKKLWKQFEEYAKQMKIMIEPINFIAFLQSYDLLDNQEVIRKVGDILGTKETN